MPQKTKNAETDPRVAAIAELVAAKKLADAEALYAELKALALAAPKDPARAQAQAQAAVQIILLQGYDVGLEDVQGHFQDVLALAKAWPKDAAMALELANASYRLIGHYDNAKQPDKAAALYAELRELAQAHPGDARLTLAQAKGAANLTSAYANANNPDQARAVYDELKALALAQPGNAEMALRQAKGAANLTKAYAEANNPDQARAVYDELKALAEAQPGNAELASCQASGAVNLTRAYANANNPDQAQAVYDELKALAEAQPNNQAQAVYDELKALAEAQPNNQAQAVYDELKALAEAQPGNAELSLCQAMAAENLGLAYFRVPDLAKALPCFEESAALCASLTAPGAQEYRAKIARTLAIARGRMGTTAPAPKPPKSAKPPAKPAKPPAKAAAAEPGAKAPSPPESEDAALGAAASAPSTHRIELQTRLVDVINEFRPQKSRFTTQMKARKKRVVAFLEPRSLFAPQASVLLVLRKWNSFTPIIMDGDESDRGGGYFLFHQGIGLVMDPGYDFIEQFHYAGGRIHDITHIAITHAHDDHTAQLEQLLTMLHQYNEQNAGAPKKVTLLLNHSAMKKFSGFRLHKDCAYVKRVVCLNAPEVGTGAAALPLQSGQAEQVQTLRLHDDGQRAELELTVLPAYHDDVFSADYAVGLGLSIPAGEVRRRILLTSDTGLFPAKYENGKVATYANPPFEGVKRVREDEPGLAVHKRYPKPFDAAPDLLIPHIGSIKEYEFDPDPSTDMPMFYPNHLGLLGTATLIMELEPTAVILSEFGSELRDFRMHIALLLTRALEHTHPHIFPGDSTIVYNIPDGAFLCHDDCQFHQPADIEAKEVEDDLIGLFLKGSSSASLKKFRSSLKLLRDSNQKEEAVQLPFMRPLPS
ncbi:MAG: hypothetical protein KKA55_08770 [Proteobacteria bacterium]|nr:hypothetical protein [Pseudomonadota bacterium]MBU1595608.1 hypothetical protein [Pseudomonadota bacterium]